MSELPEVAPRRYPRIDVALILLAVFTLPACGSAKSGSRPPTEAAVSHGSTEAAWQYPDLSHPAKLGRGGRDDVAIVVAIEDYAFLPDVSGAVRNANDWELFFRQSLGLREVYVLYNEQASKEEILDITNRAVSSAKPGSTVWFVFVGHGAPTEDASDGVLVGMDAKGTAKSLDARGLKRTELLRALQAGSQDRTIALFDACFSGRAESGESLAPGVQPVVPMSALTGRGDIVVMSAAKANQVAGALPGANRPAFSYLVLGALRGWADTPEAGTGEPDRVVTTDEVEQYVARQLRMIPGRTQVPDFVGPDQFALTTKATESKPRFERPRPRRLAPTGPEPSEVVTSKPTEAEAKQRLRDAETVERQLSDASAACEEGLYSKCHQLVTDALRTAPDLRRAWGMLVSARLHLEDDPGAVEALRTYISKSDSWTITSLNRLLTDRKYARLYKRNDYRDLVREHLGPEGVAELDDYFEYERRSRATEIAGAHPFFWVRWAPVVVNADIDAGLTSHFTLEAGLHPFPGMFFGLGALLDEPQAYYFVSDFDFLGIFMESRVRPTLGPRVLMGYVPDNSTMPMLLSFGGRLGLAVKPLKHLRFDVSAFADLSPFGLITPDPGEADPLGSMIGGALGVTFGPIVSGH